MRRTITLLVVEAIIIVGLLVPALAVAQGGSDDAISADRVASLEEQVRELKQQLHTKVLHVHLDAHEALGEPLDDVNYLPDTYMYPADEPGTGSEGTGQPTDVDTYIYPPQEGLPLGVGGF